MMELQGSTAAGGAEPAPSPQTRKAVQPGKPIVGFLYSISRTRVGEFWPLQMGRNTIGQAEDSDILLAEGTVSSNHAVIVTRQIKSGIIAAITDSQSTNGTMINGEPIGFSAEECHDGDIITIGNNYELVLILIDAEKRGLKVSQDFIPVEVQVEDEEQEDVPSFSGGTTRPGGFDPYNDGPTAWGNNGGGYSPVGGTVGMDGSMPGGNHGGTVPM
jgi:pSer/pThr/pTyr-binding forkhead associated (FHA) protein